MFHLSKRAAAVVTVGALMAFQALAIVGAGSAAAVTGCSFDLATHTVGVSIDAGEWAQLWVNDTTDAIEGTGTDGAFACGLADTTNTTQVVVAGSTGDEWFYLDNTSNGAASADQVSFPATIAFQIALGTGTNDGVDIYLNDAGSNVAVTNTGFTVDGTAGLFGGAENFEVDGGVGDDTIDGSALTASGPYFEVYAYDGDDTITGGAGDDFLAGQVGDDTVSGGDGDDDLGGGPGDDTLTAGAGDDSVYGGPDADTIVEDAAANGSDFLDGACVLCGSADAGDTIDYSARTTDTVVNADTGAWDSGEDTNADGDAVDTGDEGDQLWYFDTFVTGSGNDTLTGSGINETFMPGEGDDAVDGNGGYDTLSYDNVAGPVSIDVAGETASGAGADTFVDMSEFVGSAADDTLVWDGVAYWGDFYGGDGIDTIDASSATDDVSLDLSLVGDADVENAIGGSGNDDLTGSALRNSLWGGEGDDSLDGAGGNDTLYPGPGSDDMLGGTGVDLVSFADATSGVDVDLSLGTASSADGDDTLSGIEGVVGSAFADSIVGDGFTNLIKSGKGADFVRAGAGDDTVKGGGADDTLVGGSGDDSIWGRAGDDALFGGGGTDYGNGGKGSDTCKGVEIKKSC